MMPILQACFQERQQYCLVMQVFLWTNKMDFNWCVGRIGLFLDFAEHATHLSICVLITLIV